MDLEAGMVARAPLFHWSLQGTGGAFLKSGLDPQEAQLQSGKIPGTEGFGVEPPELAGWLYHAVGEPERLLSPPGNYAAFYDNVAGVLMRGILPEFPVEDGLRVVRLLELCRQSAAEARTVLL